jgi:hypothetical protein
MKWRYDRNEGDGRQAISIRVKIGEASNIERPTSNIEGITGRYGGGPPAPERLAADEDRDEDQGL